ncbi:MAG: MBL fold metallo-hydrolase [Vicinamibacterales bacterium]|nr:MBL fold metallo-hydrolase [Vicinamibacterales bacterium]
MSLTRRDFLATSSVAIAGLAVSRLPAWAQPAAPLVTAFTEVRRGVGMFTATGGTIGYLVNADGAVAVDSQYAPNAEICVKGLRERAPKGIDMLINTHHHGDHVGGNQVFRSAVRRIVAHENCLAWHRKTAQQAGTEGQTSFADTTFTDTWKADFGDETIHARHYGPGHTSGDAVITFERANIVHGGDLLFRRVHPFIDRPAGASIANWVRTLEKVASAGSADTIFIFGHGKDGVVQGTREDVTYFRNYLQAALDHAVTGVKAGRSKEEVTALAALPGFEDVAALGARLNMAAVLGVAFDEARGLAP